jgi:hypothetical protein
MYLEGSSIRPDVIQVLTVDGRCLAACNGAIAGNFGWKPPTGGVYFVRMKAGRNMFVEKIVCSDE